MTPAAAAVLSGAAGLEVARARHPAANSGRPPIAPLAVSLLGRLRSRGVLQAEVAAAVIATRAQWGADRAHFSSVLGLTPGELAALEAGRVSYDAVPPTLLAAHPFAALLACLQGR